MTRTKVSDKKALLMQGISDEIKNLVGLERTDIGAWTASFEESLARVSNTELDHLQYLISTLPALAKAKKLSKT